MWPFLSLLGSSLEQLHIIALSPMISPSNLRINFNAIGVTIRQKSIFKPFSFSGTNADVCVLPYLV